MATIKHTSWVLGLVGLAAFASATVFAGPSTNRQVIERWMTIMDNKQLDQLAKVEASDLVFTSPMGNAKSSRAHAEILKGFATAFPNFKHTVSRCVESGEMISCEGRFIGDNTGPLMTPDGKTVPPTRKHVDAPWAAFATIKGQKVTTCNVYYDVMGLLGQLGLGPAGPTASK